MYHMNIAGHLAYMVKGLQTRAYIYIDIYIYIHMYTGIICISICSPPPPRRAYLSTSKCTKSSYFKDRRCEHVYARSVLLLHNVVWVTSLLSRRVCKLSGKFINHVKGLSVYVHISRVSMVSTPGHGTCLGLDMLPLYINHQNNIRAIE